MRPLLDYSITIETLVRLLSASSELDPSLTFTGITSSDKNVEPGDLFLAYPGKNSHGAQFARTAIANGALAILTDSEGAKIAKGLPIIVVENIRSAGALVSAHLYKNPMKEMVSIGITGTNGKTTVSTLLYQLFQASGRESGLIGTVETRIGTDVIASTRTTPEADYLQALSAAMSERHLRHLVMEVSSHALVAKRMHGAHFAIAGFTNLSQDHLDFHPDMELYFLAKASLFSLEYADLALINIDDNYGRRLFENSKIPAVSVARDNPKATWHFVSRTSTAHGFDFTIRGAGGILIESATALRGNFNLDNLLLVVAIATECGLDPLDIAALLPGLTGAPGRMESVEAGQNFKAIVDYAHTPDAVANVLSAAREFTTGKLISVLGCGGDRDNTKRPIMGSALAAGSDIAIFTSDNPRNENPDHILTQMTSGITVSQPSRVISDRREAIAYALSQATEGDTVLILGKGHELGQEILGEKFDFDDRRVLKEEMGNLG